MAISIEKIKIDLVNDLDSNRYEHTLGVAYTSMCLSMRYGYDIEKAQIAGLLHDCAKSIPNAEKIKICNKNNIKITDAEQKNPNLLHAKVGKHIAKTKYNISDEDILNAILYHTTGRPNMKLLEKIVYIADYIEPSRNKVKNLKKIRKYAFIDLDECLIKILKNSVKYINFSQDIIDPLTEKTYKYYKSIIYVL